MDGIDRSVVCLFPTLTVAPVRPKRFGMIRTVDMDATVVRKRRLGNVGLKGEGARASTMQAERKSRKQSRFWAEAELPPKITDAPAAETNCGNTDRRTGKCTEVFYPRLIQWGSDSSGDGICRDHSRASSTIIVWLVTLVHGGSADQNDRLELRAVR